MSRDRAAPGVVGKRFGRAHCTAGRREKLHARCSADGGGTIPGSSVSYTHPGRLPDLVRRRVRQERGPAGPRSWRARLPFGCNTPLPALQGGGTGQSAGAGLLVVVPEKGGPRGMGGPCPAQGTPHSLAYPAPRLNSRNHSLLPPAPAQGTPHPRGPGRWQRLPQRSSPRRAFESGTNPLFDRGGEARFWSHSCRLAATGMMKMVRDKARFGVSHGAGGDRQVAGRRSLVLPSPF
jgi:hypothetical protein